MKKNLSAMLIVSLFICSCVVPKKESPQPISVEASDTSEYICTGTYGDIYRISKNGSTHLEVRKENNNKN